MSEKISLDSSDIDYEKDFICNYCFMELYIGERPSYEG